MKCCVRIFVCEKTNNKKDGRNVIHNTNILFILHVLFYNNDTPLFYETTRTPNSVLIKIMYLHILAYILTDRLHSEMRLVDSSSPSAFQPIAGHR